MLYSSLASWREGFQSWRDSWESRCIHEYTTWIAQDKEATKSCGQAKGCVWLCVCRGRGGRGPVTCSCPQTNWAHLAISRDCYASIRREWLAWVKLRSWRANISRFSNTGAIQPGVSIFGVFYLLLSMNKCLLHWLALSSHSYSAGICCVKAIQDSPHVKAGGLVKQGNTGHCRNS